VLVCSRLRERERVAAEHPVVPKGKDGANVLRILAGERAKFRFGLGGRESAGGEAARAARR